MVGGQIVEYNPVATEPSTSVVSRVLCNCCNSTLCLDCSRSLHRWRSTHLSGARNPSSYKHETQDRSEVHEIGRIESRHSPRFRLHCADVLKERQGDWILAQRNLVGPNNPAKTRGMWGSVMFPTTASVEVALLYLSTLFSFCRFLQVFVQLFNLCQTYKICPTITLI